MALIHDTKTINGSRWGSKLSLIQNESGRVEMRVGEQKESKRVGWVATEWVKW